MNEVRVLNLSKEPFKLDLPVYAHQGDDAVDLMACFSCEVDSVSNKPYSILKVYTSDNTEHKAILEANDTYSLLPGDRVLIPTGLKIALPTGKKFSIKSRSGLALKSGIRVMNSPGTVDEPYRGMISVILINDSTVPFSITHGMRIAQGALENTEEILWIPVNDENSLGITDRGETGFGKSGV